MPVGLRGHPLMQLYLYCSVSTFISRSNTKLRIGSIKAEVVVDIVVEMLEGKQWLLEGFSQFLPEPCRDILYRPAVFPSEEREFLIHFSGLPQVALPLLVRVCCHWQAQSRLLRERDGI